jgi:hypothetical protein
LSRKRKEEFMDKQLRIEKLKEISQSTPYTSGIRIPYKTETLNLNAYEIPIEYLLYNKHNGRIASLVKSHEKQTDHILDPEIEEDSKIIEQFLWESKLDRNKQTMRDLIKNKQRVFGIVTFEGKIIDGNRRAMLLSKINSQGNDNKQQTANIDFAKYFIAVILPANVKDDKEISKLETIYQMGEDKKLDYNPIEKYLKCSDLTEIFDYSEAEIAEMMSESKPTIKEWLEIKDLMDDYLGHYGYDEIYTRLTKREGQFVNLNGYLKKYSNKSKDKNVQWMYKDKDVAAFKAISFDYIRAQYEGKQFRSIGQTSKAGSIFQHKDIWDEFSENHETKIDSISDEEPTVEEVRKDNPGGDLSKLLESRDQDWINKAEGHLEGNLNIGESRLQNKKEANKPLQLVNRAFDTLNSINTEIDSFIDEEIDKILGKMILVINKYRSKIKKNSRN